VASPFEALESEFRRLSEATPPLTVDGVELGPAFPSRAIPVAELRGILLHPSTPYDAQNQAVALLVERASDEGEEWLVAAAGVLLPGLRAALAVYFRLPHVDPDEVEAEALADLIRAIRHCDEVDRIAPRLISRAARRTKRRVASEALSTGRHVTPLSAEPHRPWGHPDFVLAEAVKAGVLSPEDADLIGETRLGDLSLHAYSQATGIGLSCLKMRRRRAEPRLISWLRHRNV
jgi:hypothetical protein